MDYKYYKFSVWEYVKYTFIGLCITSFLSFFFYKSWKALLLSLVLLPFFLRYEKNRLKKLRIKRLADEFSETLYSVSTNMMAGYSAENAFKESYKDLIRFYGPKSLMAKEILRMNEGLSVNVSIEDLMEDLANRSDVEDIHVFSEVFRTAKRNGGNLKDVLHETATTIREKMRIEREIDVIVSEKRYELRIMETVPFFILTYISVTSPGYFEPLYHNTRGIIAMTICLGIYIFAVFLGKKIINVAV